MALKLSRRLGNQKSLLEKYMDQINASFNDFIKLYLHSRGISVEIQFVPLSKSPNHNLWQSLNWRVTIRREQDSVEFNYAQSVWSVEPQTHPRMNRMLLLEKKEAIHKLCEQGVWFGESVKNPPLADIIFWILDLAEPFERKLTFEQWCEENDYRQDEEIRYAAYQEYLKLATDLEKILGKRSVRYLNDLKQTYRTCNHVFWNISLDFRLSACSGLLS